jgi:hypothetical protein
VFEMSLRKTAIAVAALAFAALASTGLARAADLPAKAVKTAPDLPFFLLIDDRVTFSYIFTAKQPGMWVRNPDGTVNSNVAKQVYSFTHFDIWQYGTNFFGISLYKSGHTDSANPCTGAPAGQITDPLNGFASVQANCAGASEIYGLFRSTFSWNDIFGTKAFTMGPLHNISFEVGMDANTENRYFAVAKRDVVAGLQFQFDLPYKGFFNVAPLVYWEFSSHNAFSQCGAGWTVSNIPGFTCLADGNPSFKPTWAVETNYYMDLGFLPPSMDYFSISGRLAWYGQKGTDTNPLPFFPANQVFNTKVEFNSEPIRLTFDASKAMWGPKYTHFVDVWVAYRYWQNKFGLDHNAPSIGCSAPVNGVNVASGACTESSLYSGITVKF